jgi:hypothetical protein
MMHYATVPNAFDIAVLVSGDRDFVPALVRTRGKGKRVAVCSMRGSASYDYADPAANIKDFGVLWIDDHLDEATAANTSTRAAQRAAHTPCVAHSFFAAAHVLILHAAAPRSTRSASSPTCAMG